MTKDEMNDEDFSQDKVPSSSWMKFVKVGDFVKGTIVEQYNKPGQGDFKDQVVYVLTNCEAVMDGKKSTEKDINVGISSNYINSRFKSLQPGQRIGIQFEKEIAAKIKGHKPAKSLLPNIFGIDKNFKAEDFKKDIDFD